MATMKALAPWFGAKREQVPGIIKALGPHRSYWEPFCGSMSVLFGKEPCRSETVNDLHAFVTNLAKVAQDEDMGVRLFDRLCRTLHCEGLYEEAVAYCEGVDEDELRAEPSLEAAYQYVLASWMGRNGLAGSTDEFSSGFSFRYTDSGGNSAVRFRSAAESVPYWWTRLQRVTVLSRDAFKLMEKIEDGDGVAMYVDCPYFAKGGDYLHDFTPEAHERLAVLLRRFKKTRLVVSYYEHPAIQHLYLDHGFTNIPCHTKKKMDSGAGKVAPEVLLVKNGGV